MKRKFVLCLAILSMISGAFAQKNLHTDHPGYAAERFSGKSQDYSPQMVLATLPETLDAVFDSITALTPVKGFNAAMLLPDGACWKRSAGLAQELPVSAPLTTEHLMGMGSISKTFVSTTLLLLMEDGNFSLDDSIGQYIGPYPNISGSITIRQLLSHRSGLNDYLNENPATGEAWGNDLEHLWTFDEILNHYVLAPNFMPGEDWSYSNTNFLLAGVLIEYFTGQSWSVVVRERLLNPLGLTHTFVYPWETPPSDQPFSHVWADLLGNGLVQDAQGLGLTAEGLFSLASSAGCLITTPEDLAKFMASVFGGQVLQQTTLDEMQTDYLLTGGVSYGLGVASFPAPQNLENWGHDGDLIYKSVALFFPSENMSLAVQQNDDRLNDPNVPSSPDYDLYGVFEALLNAYLNYTATTATTTTQTTNVLSVYPNPTEGLINIEYPFAAKEEPIYLLDIYGRIIASQISNNQYIRFDLSNLPEGVYYIKTKEHCTSLVKQ